MKVICIESFAKCLTKGKLYETYYDPPISSHLSVYFSTSRFNLHKLNLPNLIGVVDDMGRHTEYPIRLFLTLEESRNKKLKELGI